MQVALKEACKGNDPNNMFEVSTDKTYGWIKGEHIKFHNYTHNYVEKLDSFDATCPKGYLAYDHYTIDDIPIIECRSIIVETVLCERYISGTCNNLSTEEL